MKNTVAVITGDLINSSGLNEDQKKQIKEKLEDSFRKNQFIIQALQFYRGDSFQLMCTKEKAAWASLLIEATIISIANTMARVSIGIGLVSRLDEKDILQSEGQAFTLSGQSLDEMKSENRILKITTDDAGLQQNLEIVFRLVENIILEWKPGQASVMALNLLADKQKDIAAQLEISPAAVSKTLKTAKWALIEDFLDWYEKGIKNFTA